MEFGARGNFIGIFSKLDYIKFKQQRSQKVLSTLVRARNRNIYMEDRDENEECQDTRDWGWR